MTIRLESASAPLCGPGGECAILFARAPVPRRVKSRLLPRLSPEQACALHCAATSDTAALLAETLPHADLWLFLSEAPPGSEPGVPTAGEIVLPPRFRCALQAEGNLGERMGAAFVRALSSGARGVVIFGSDSPTLPLSVPPQAFASLLDSDLVLGPAEDGGYYLIGCRRFDPPLLEGVEWSTPRTGAQTLANAARLGYRTALLERWFDLDSWNDVERLLADARGGTPLPPHLAACFQEWKP
jgi:rSAM/selenodomain-associated transferase 1